MVVQEIEEVMELGWFDWVNNLPLWLQLVIGVPFGLVCISVVYFSIQGMCMITERLRQLFDETQRM